MTDTVTKSPALVLQEALFGILSGAADDLAVDTRDVTVLNHWPEQAFTQRAMPLVVVERPMKTDTRRMGGSDERVVFDVPVLLAESCGVKSGDESAALERMEQILNQIKGVLERAVNINLGLATYGVFRSLCEWTEGEVENAGNNLLVWPLKYRVSMTLERGKNIEEEVE